MCDSLDGDDDEIFEQPYFAGGEHLDASVVEAILRPYPELWSQWRARVQRPKASRELGTGGLKRYHSPTYLKAVIREYDYLRESGDRPDPALAARCEEIVSTRPEFAKKRRQELSDPWLRALNALTPEMCGYEPVGVSSYYDPAWLQSQIDLLNEHDDPFSHRTIEFHQWSEKFSFPPDTRKAAGPHN